MGPGVRPRHLSRVLHPFCFPRWILFLKFWGSGQGWGLNKQPTDCQTTQSACTYGCGPGHVVAHMWEFIPPVFLQVPPGTCRGELGSRGPGSS